MQFTTHVPSATGIPIQGSDYIIYRPVHTLKLEVDRVVRYNSKIVVEKCEKGGHIEVSIVDTYKDKVKLLGVTKFVEDSNPIVLQLLNITDTYIRIEKEEHVLVFTYISDTPAPVEDTEVPAPAEEVSNPVEDTEVPSPVEEVPAPVEDTEVSNPVEEVPAPVEDTEVSNPVEEVPAPVEDTEVPAPVEDTEVPAPVEDTEVSVVKEPKKKKATTKTKKLVVK